MLFDWQMGKWRCRPKKVYKFLWEIFVAACKKKASKVVDDSRGKFWWIGRRRRGSLESCESAPLLHLTSPAAVF